MAHQNLSEDMRRCIQECLECYSVCTETLTHCLEKGGAHVEASHIRILLDCAEACRTSADFMLRGSELHGRTCALCAEACDRCAADCDGLADDPVMKRCAEVCRRCAASCRQMAA